MFTKIQAISPCFNHCDVMKKFTQNWTFTFINQKSKLKSLPEFELGLSREQILWSSKGFSDDLITYQRNSYSSKLFNVAVDYLYLRLKKSSELLNLKV